MSHHIHLSELSILLVEPSDTQRKIISSMLLEAQIGQIEGAGGVQEAVQKIANHGFDLVISSMYFSDGTGLDLLRHLKGNKDTESMPFMLVSSEYRPSKLQEFKQSGVVAILPKPFEPIHLTRALNATLDLLNTEELDLDFFDVEQIRVLIVDDSKLARNHMRRVLEGMGIKHFSEAENGALALTLLKENPYDLVVTDYNMPEMDGRELSEFIRFNPETAHIPVIMVSSEANSSHMANIQQTGVNALCDKPFESAEVRQILVSLMAS